MYNVHVAIENISNTSGLCVLIAIFVRTMHNVHVTNENISNASGLHHYNYLHTVFTTNDTHDLLL